MGEPLIWYNLFFLLPLAIGALLLVLQAFGMASDHDADHDVSVDHDVDADHDIDGDHDSGFSLAKGALGMLGVGRVPMMVVVTTFCLVWGFAGYASNTLLGPILRFPQLFFWISTGIATVVAFFATGVIARVIARLLPTAETYVTTRDDLVGHTAKTLFVIERPSCAGRARLYDKYDNLQEVAIVADPSECPIASGSSVVLLAFDDTSDTYRVKRDELGN